MREAASAECVKRVLGGMREVQQSQHANQLVRRVTRRRTVRVVRTAQPLLVV